MNVPASQELLDHGARRAWLSIALASIVRAAEHMPQGCPERRTLAEAARPLREHLYGSTAP